MGTLPKFGLCLIFLLATCAACATEPEPIILKTPIASATPYVTPAPAATQTRQAIETRAVVRLTRTPSARGRTPSPQPVTKININTADENTLGLLPRIGSVLARRIIAYRQARGPFSKIENIKDVSGIGDATFQAIKDLITVE